MRRAFEGILAYVDEPSDVSPRGTRGHRVVLSRAAFETARETLLNAPMRTSHPPFGDTADLYRCGVIEDAQLAGNAIRLRGSVDLEAAIPDGPCLLSYELKNAHVVDVRAAVWLIVKCEFTGVAMVRDGKAANLRSSFRLMDHRLSFEGKENARRSLRMDR